MGEFVEGLTNIRNCEYCCLFNLYLSIFITDPMIFTHIAYVTSWHWNFTPTVSSWVKDVGNNCHVYVRASANGGSVIRAVSLLQSRAADGRVYGEYPVTSLTFNTISAQPQLPIILPVDVHICVSEFFRAVTTESMEVEDFVLGEGNEMDGRKPEPTRWWHLVCQMKPRSVLEIGSNGTNLLEDYLFKGVKSCFKFVSYCLVS